MLFAFLLQPHPTVFVSRCIWTSIKSQLLLFFKKKKTTQPGEGLCCFSFVCNLELSPSFFPLPRRFLSNTLCLNPPFSPHFYRFLGYKRFHLVMHVPASPPPHPPRRPAAVCHPGALSTVLARGAPSPVCPPPRLAAVGHHRANRQQALFLPQSSRRIFWAVCWIISCACGLCQTPDPASPPV